MNRIQAARIHVIGAGLIGTSFALACKGAGYTVTIEDVDTSNQALAKDLLFDNHDSKRVDKRTVNFVIVAVPPSATSKVVAGALKLYPQSIVTDVSSVKTKVINEVKELSDDFSRYVPGHPIAGRQHEGPAAAQADLFSSRPWILTPLENTSQSGLQDLSILLGNLGASVRTMTPDHHDHLFARISHVPQLISTALGGSLVEIGDEVSLSGQGLRDTTRLAESKASLWTEIVSLNSKEILEALKHYREIIMGLENAITKGDMEEVSKQFDLGNRGRLLLSGKHGGKPRDYIFFRIVIDDRPGVLAELFALCGERRVNVEDLDIEHSPNQETGLITLAISPEQEAELSSALEEGSWRFHIQRTIGAEL